MEQNKVSNARSKPEEMSSKKRMLYELETILDMSEKDMEMNIVDCKRDHQRRTPNRDLYKLYKAACQELGVKPRIVYTGKSMVEYDDFKDMEEGLDELEPAL